MVEDKRAPLPRIRVFLIDQVGDELHRLIIKFDFITGTGNSSADFSEKSAVATGKYQFQNGGSFKKAVATGVFIAKTQLSNLS